jgi:serine/threonine-protein kinase
MGTWKRGLVWIAACVILTATPARAQDASSAARAEALFQEARQLMSQDKYTEACPKLAASQKLDPGPGTLMNLAGCYEKNGQAASAWATWIEAQSASERAGHADWAATCRDRAAAILPKVSRLSVVVPPSSEVPGLVVERDGVRVERAEWGSAVPVDPGTHPVTASAPGRQPWSAMVQISPNGAAQSVHVPVLEASPTEAPMPTPIAAPLARPSEPAHRQESAAPEPASSWTTGRVAGAAMAGLGVVGLAVGGFYGLKAKSTHDDALNHCEGTDCYAEGLELDSEARDQATISTVAVASGLGLIAAGAALYLVSSPSQPSRETTVAVGLRPSAQGLSLSMGGAW